MSTHLNSKRTRHWLGIATVLVGVVALGGCAPAWEARPVVTQPVTVKQIVAWSKAGESPDEIINRMRSSETVYRLSASQLADLRQEGVSDQVIDYMQHTYLDSVQRSASLENLRYWHLYDGYWYGGIPFGWPYGWYWPDTFAFYGNYGHYGGGHEFHEHHGGFEGHGRH